MGFIYPSELNRVLRSPGGTVGKVVRRVSLDVAAEAKSIAQAELGIHPGDRPRTGQYADGFKVLVVTTPNGFYYTVSNKKKYAIILEKGSRAHIIRARKERTLQFRGRDGRFRQVKIVQHPGTKAYRILQRAGEIVGRRLQ
jgi:hypothetical protein